MMAQAEALIPGRAILLTCLQQTDIVTQRLQGDKLRVRHRRMAHQLLRLLCR